MLASESFEPHVVSLGLNEIDSPVNGGEQRSYWLNQIFERHGIAHDYRARQSCLNYFRPAKRRTRGLRDRLKAKLSGVSYAMLRDLGFHRRSAIRLTRHLPGDFQRIEGSQVVLFDQPFAYPFYRSRLEGKVVVYSSQNIESQIIKDYFQKTATDEAEMRILQDRIDLAESELTRRADLVVACTEADAEHYRQLGGREVVCAPNGSMPIPPGASTDRAGVPFSRYALMISSNWTPNVAGLMEYCRDLTLPEGCGLVCAGSIVNASAPSFAEFKSNPSCAFTGRVDLDRLAALVSGASAIIIPMLSAGGSNVKTAEALLSDRTIIATPAAFRGYEAFEHAPGVCLADTPEDFCKEIVRQLERDPATWARPEVDRLRWPNALSPAEDALLELLDGCRSGIEVKGA